MPKAKVVFTVFTVLFELLYALMMWMFFAELEGETDPLARAWTSASWPSGRSS